MEHLSDDMPHNAELLAELDDAELVALYRMVRNRGSIIEHNLKMRALNRGRAKKDATVDKALSDVVDMAPQLFALRGFTRWVQLLNQEMRRRPNIQFEPPQGEDQDEPSTN